MDAFADHRRAHRIAARRPREGAVDPDRRERPAGPVGRHPGELVGGGRGQRHRLVGPAGRGAREPGHGVGSVDVQDGGPDQRRPHSRPRYGDRVDIARPLGEVGDREGVAADPAPQIGLGVEAMVGRGAGAGVAGGIDRDRIAPDAGHRQRPGGMAEADRVRDRVAVDPAGLWQWLDRGRPRVVEAQPRGGGRALVAGGVLQPDLGRVLARLVGRAKPADPGGFAGDPGIADDDRAGRVADAVVDGGDTRARRIAPGEAEAVVRVPGFLAAVDLQVIGVEGEEVGGTARGAGPQ